MKKEKTKKILKRIKLPRTIRLTIIAIITIILILSITKLYIAYNTPETTEITYETLSYNHNSEFNYKAYLKNNTVYEGIEYLAPGEGTNFRKIIDYINASFTYTFLVSKTANISGYYSLDAEIQTNQYTKKYKLIPTTSINSSGTTFNFMEEFPIDYQSYEEIVNKIDQEIGINSASPYLVYKFDIFLSINVDGKNIIQSYTPSMNVSLGGNIIGISDDLSDTITGSKTETQEIFHQEIINERNNWTIISLTTLIALLIVTIITRSILKKPSIEQTIKKIMKKNGEWIVEVEKPIKELHTLDVVNCKTIDDLIKISEQLAKPIIHVQQNKNNHTFYVIDEKTRYENVIESTKNNEKTEETEKNEISDDIKKVIIELSKHDVPIEGIISQIENEIQENNLKPLTKKIVNMIIKENHK